MIKKNKLTKALKSYCRIHSSKTAEARLTALQIVIEKEVEAEKHKDGKNFLQCFRGSDWRRTRIIMYANVLQQLVGVAMVTNSIYFLELGGMASQLALRFNVIHIGVGLFFLFVSFFVMTMMGRRALLLIGTFLCAILWIGMGIAGCFNQSQSALV